MDRTCGDQPLRPWLKPNVQAFTGHLVSPKHTSQPKVFKRGVMFGAAAPLLKRVPNSYIIAGHP